MDYKYSPIYKYGLLLLIIYMFLKHQKVMTSDKILINSVAIVIFIGIFDYVLIRNHPSLFEQMPNENFEETVSEDDIDDIINSYESSHHEDTNIDQSVMGGGVSTRENKQYYSTDMIYQ